MSDEKSQEQPKKREGWTAAEAAEIAKATAEAAEARLVAAKAGVEAAAKEYETAVEAAAKAAVEAEKEYEAAAKTAMAKAAAEVAGKPFSNKYKQERVFRREMGEPEFFHTKKDLVPPRPVLTEEEQEEISRKVEIPIDVTPPYRPEFVLDPRFGGTSDYESGMNELLEETRQKLDRLKNGPYASADEISRTEEDLSYLESFMQNYYYGMNVFRTAKGGRSKLRE